MEVCCLNGMAVMVEPLECLQEAKVKVASALGVFPEAVRISCRGQILGGDFEALELCLAKLDMDIHETLFGLVDQKRMELARHLHVFEPELVACEKQKAQNEKMSAELEQKKKELFSFCISLEISDIQRVLREGNLSLEKEKALVSRLPKLQRLEKMEEVLYQETDNLYTLRNRLQQKVFQVRTELQAALFNPDHPKDSPDEILAEFDEISRAWQPHHWAYAFSDGTWWDSEEAEREIQHLEKLETAFGKIELKDSCPRLLRREDWSNSKRSWKNIRRAPQVPQVPQAPPGERCDSGWRPRKCKRRQRRCQRVSRVISEDVRCQLQEYSVYGQ